jgi:hypothetical protein
MIQMRAVHTQAEAHQMNLLSTASPRAVRSARSRRQGATLRSAAGFPVPGGRAPRRAVAPRVGAWLIGLGTRLGGASIRTS